MKPRISLLALIVIGLISLPVAGASKQWLHVQVHGDSDEKVNVNIPLSLVSTILPLIEDKAEEGLSRHGHWDDSDMSVSQMREIWNAVKSEGAFELASVNSGEHRFSIFLDGQYLRVESDEGAKERVTVKLPTVLVDALLSGEGENFNIMAALDALQNLGNQELVLVEADDTRVRVWIDEFNAPGR